MHACPPASPFTSLAAVQAWDAWFRWREGTQLRDTAIEDTWNRVASTLAAAESHSPQRWREAWLEALANWRVLPDEQVLATAGTGHPGWRRRPLHAVVNATAFVKDDGTMDLAGLAHAAGLALRAMDNAMLLAGTASGPVRIGLIGLADVLALAGESYGSARGRTRATEIVRAMADGCLTANLQLAHERGAGIHGSSHVAVERLRRRGVSGDIVGEVERHGLRHADTMTLAPHPRLALLANDVADACDPLAPEHHTHPLLGAETACCDGYAFEHLRALRADTSRTETLASLPPSAGIAMRAALRPWADDLDTGLHRTAGRQVPAETCAGASWTPRNGRPNGNP